MADLAEELKDLQSNVALGILGELQTQGKITDDQSEYFKQMFANLHEAVVQSFQNHKLLHARTKKIKQEFLQEKLKLDQSATSQQQNQDLVEEHTHILRKAENELDLFNQKVEYLELELEEKRREKQDRANKIKEEQNEAKMNIQPEVNKFNNQIKELNDEITKRTTQSETEKKRITDIQEKLNTLRQDIDKNIEEKLILQDQLMKVKDEPTRWKKTADMIENANSIMDKDAQGIFDEIEKKKKQLSDVQAEIAHLQEKYEEYDKVVRDDREEIEKCNSRMAQVQAEISVIRDEHDSLAAERVRQETELMALTKQCRRISDQITTIKKEIDQHKKEYRKAEQQKYNLKDQIRELEMAMKKIEKEDNDIKFELSKQAGIKEKIVEDKKLLEFEEKQIHDNTQNKIGKIAELKKKIIEYEKHITELQSIEQNAQKTIKNLTALRESMARKASQAMIEVKETREELKIKELLILDLTKKQQETEFKLNSFKVLYEEVKSARNKYVNLIQNSSQHLAELKEKIKIIMNELEILKNESAEKDRTLMEYKHFIQLEIHQRDRRHAKLNKFEVKKREKKAILDQQINEIEKQNMILHSLEKEMKDLRHKYETACESRNYTGIQLIDRNDELCILYEKANIQENIMKNGEREIQKLEDDIRMIKIEAGETKRKIEIALKEIPDVPKLADQVIQLREELNVARQKERELAEELENPNNQKRWRELEGEDPDQEALEAKIQVLEERLNNKKEALLERELILDEITTLSEKLRTQALEGRQDSLKLSEKVNEVQARLKDLTRKMMATISELSMFQANSMKLQSERDYHNTILEECRERAEKGLPPTPDVEVEYQKMVRDKIRYQQDREARLQQEEFLKNLPPFATLSAAPRRLDQYIPNGDIEGQKQTGLSKPYGSHAPFAGSKKSANMRHIKKPTQREIEI